MSDDRDPAVAVVVPSRGRRLRLRWLLNALEHQTLAHERWEMIVVHDYSGRDLELLENHPLTRAGRMRHIQVSQPERGPACLRNIGWRASRAPLVAFTDDDCRPECGWLEALMAAAAHHPGAIVQGATRYDPLEIQLSAAPHWRSMVVDPPGPYAQTCNILYPRSVLEQTGGFDERFPAAAGEDVDLALRALRRGTGYVGASEAVIYHAVESYSLASMIRLNFKWQHVAYLAKRHPEVRRGYAMRVFWRESHLRLALAALGVVSARRRKILGVVLAVPYLHAGLSARGPRRRARAVAAAELPGRIVVDLFEVLTLIWGSVRYRTIVL